MASGFELSVFPNVDGVKWRIKWSKIFREGARI